MQKKQTKDRIPLTELQTAGILTKISQRCHSEDRQPEEVIRKKYNGDIDAYVQDMLAADPNLKSQYQKLRL